MYRGEPVYWNPAVLAKRTATGTGSWIAERGMLPATEALVARNVIVPIGVGYTEHDCDDIAAADHQGRARGPGMKVGVGVAVITPESMPVHLAGFAEPQRRHEVHDDLEVRAVVRRDGDVAVCLLVCDLLGMSHHFADPVRAAVGRGARAPARGRARRRASTRTPARARWPAPRRSAGRRRRATAPCSSTAASPRPRAGRSRS